MEISRNLRVESVSRLEPTPPRSVEQGQTIRDAIALMRQDRVGCLLVVEDGRLVGVFTERDLLCRVLGCNKPLSTPVKEVMTPEPITISPSDSIRTAIRRMQQGEHRHLPVINENNEPVGILSVKRIIHYLVEHFPGAVYNLPPEPNGILREREGA
jgi:CBS domain-containing protein